MQSTTSPSSASWFGCPTDQRQQQEAIDQPVAGERYGYADQQPEQRIYVVEGEGEERGKCAGREELSVGEVQHAGDAVLEIEAEGDQAVHPAEDKAVQHHFEHGSARPPGSSQWAGTD